MTTTPIYESEVCRILHGVAFQAWAQQLPRLQELTECHFSIFQATYEWIAQADEATDEFSDTTGYYPVFYRKFRNMLPHLPTPEAFNEKHSGIATGLER